MASLEKSTKFPAKVVAGMFNTVRGKSSLAKLANQMPVAFTGNSIFTFSMDNELAIVAESAAKEAGGITAEPVVIQPIKVEYGARVSDEFLYAAEEDQLNLIENFAEGFAAKLARAIDIIGMHGMNPRTLTPSNLVTSYIDMTGVQTEQVGASADATIEAAVAKLGSYDATGIALSKTMAASLAAETENGVKKYPQLAWGGQPEAINGLACSVNSTVDAGNVDLAIVGDFSAFRWGYAKEIPVEIIQYGDPDNSGSDLKGHNQVYLRAEAYIGCAVLDTAAFVRVIPAG